MIYKPFQIWENFLINHLLLVIPVSYPCHYTNLCPHMSQKCAHTHTHTHIALAQHEFTYETLAEQR